MLREFGDHIELFHTQPVTIPISSVVEDMLDSHANISRGLDGGFSWKTNLERLMYEFIYTRECFFFSANRAPALEATFRVIGYHEPVLDVAIEYAWSPPVLEFADFANVVTENCEFRLQPVYPSRPRDSILCTTAEYFVGPGEGWLHWDEADESFRGIVPCDMAGQIGAERFEAYTVPLELTARITKHFPGCMRFERIMRCTLPVTVKRSPNRCKTDGPRIISPPMPGPITTGRIAALMTPKTKNAGTTQRIDTPLSRPPLLRSPAWRSRAGHQRSPPLQTPRTCMTGVDGKEDTQNKAEARKCAISRPESPLRLNSLTLARLHEAIALANPPPLLTDIEVRTMYHARCDSSTSDAGKGNAQPSTLAQEFCKLGLGSTERADAPVLRETIGESAQVYRPELLGSRGVSREEADAWQATIQRNYREFQGKGGHERGVSVLDNCVDTDEELPSFQSDL